MTIRHCMIFPVVLAGVALSAAVRPPALTRYEFSQPQMGTVARIVLYAKEETAARMASDAAFARIRHLNSLLSDYQDDSELMRLCRQAGGPPVPVSAELFTVLREAQNLARRSDGAFDVTVGPLVRLWRRARRQQQLPTPEAVNKARSLVGYERLVLDETKRTVALRQPNMLLDLGGIAKGYAADEALAILRRHGVPSALVAMGGDIAVGTRPPDAIGWSVVIAPFPTTHLKDAPPPLVLENAGVSTSGDREQFVELEGKRYSHILDPHTGMGLTARLQVTIVATNATLSDGYATAISVLGPEKGIALVDTTPGMSALVIEVGADGRSSRHVSHGWDERAKP